MLILLALTAVAPAIAPCSDRTTLNVDACLNARLKQSDATLNRYYRVAINRITNENGAKAARKFVQAERSWIAYRNPECGSVYDRYGGTIRVSVELDCRIRLTRFRIYAIWRDWLTFPDSTPPLLPRPDVSSFPQATDARR